MGPVGVVICSVEHPSSPETEESQPCIQIYRLKSTSGRFKDMYVLSRLTIFPFSCQWRRRRVCLSIGFVYGLVSCGCTRVRETVFPIRQTIV